MPSHVRFKRAHDAALFQWLTRQHGAAVRTCLRMLKHSKAPRRILPDPSLEAVDVQAIAQQTAGFGDAQHFKDTHAMQQEMARLLQLMLSVLGPVRVWCLCCWCYREHELVLRSTRRRGGHSSSSCACARMTRRSGWGRLGILRPARCPSARWCWAGSEHWE